MILYFKQLIAINIIFIIFASCSNQYPRRNVSPNSYHLAALSPKKINDENVSDSDPFATGIKTVFIFENTVYPLSEGLKLLNLVESQRVAEPPLSAEIFHFGLFKNGEIFKVFGLEELDNTMYRVGIFSFVNNEDYTEIKNGFFVYNKDWWSFLNYLRLNVKKSEK